MKTLDAKILAMYLGCEAFGVTYTGIKVKGEICCVEIDSGFATIRAEKVTEFQIQITDIKLLLRPLSSMTEEDIKDWDDVKISHTPYCVELDSIEEFGEFTEIYPDGTIHSKSKDDGDTRPINGGKLFCVLLSKSFDLFGLIEKGLAIESRQ